MPGRMRPPADTEGRTDAPDPPADTAAHGRPGTRTGAPTHPSWRHARRRHRPADRRPAARGPGGAGADPVGPARPPLRHRRPHRPHRPGRHRARQAPADPDRGRSDPAQPPPDGRGLAGVRPGRALAGGPGHQIRAILGNAEHTAVGYRLPVLELLRTSEESRAWAIWARICWAPTWTPARRGPPARGAGAPPRRSAPGPAQSGGHRQRLQVRAVLPGPRHPLAPRGRPPRRRTPPARRPGRAPAARQPRPPHPHHNHHLRTPHPAGTEHEPGPAPRPAPAPGTAPSPTPPAGLRPRTRPPVRVQERLYVYGRARRPCLRCGTPVRLADQDDRPTYWCPGCQSGPTP
ncbi:hypothetical protein SFIMM107S_07339 [Streptomyces griseus]